MKRWGFLIMILSVFSVFLLFLSALHQNPVPVSAMQTDFDDESGGGEFDNDVHSGRMDLDDPPIVGKLTENEIPEDEVDAFSVFREDLSTEDAQVFVYTGEEEPADEVSDGISLFAARAYSTVVSGKDKVDGLTDYSDGSVNYIIENANMTLNGATVEFQKLSNGIWDTDPAPVFSFDASALTVSYNKAAGGSWPSSGVTYTDRRVKVTFPHCALGSNGQYRDVVMCLSNIYFKDCRGRTRDVIFLRDQYGTVEMTSGHECVDVFYDVDISVVGASSSEALFLLFSDLDVGYFRSHDSENWSYNGSFASRNPIESIKIMSGIYPGTQPHVPNDCILRIVDGDQPEYYATRATSDMESYRAAVSWLACATGTTYKWAGQGCSTFIGLDMSVFSKFTIKTQVRTETDTSSPTGTKSYGAWQQVDSRTFMKLMAADYSYTFTKGALGSLESLTFPSDDWIFHYSDTTMGDTDIKTDRVYSITIDRNRYTYSFNANPPSGKTASDVSNMPGSKTVTASKAASGKSDATVREPSLTGFWFMGWNTKADGTGTSYPGAETMKSDKVFYAQWKPATYVVHFNANGSVNPDHQAGEFTQNTTTGTMADQTLHFDRWENLSANAYARAGYTFAGWNTKSDGTGTAYSDRQSVRNLIGYDKSEITLYAQWTKNLGTETITVVSEETGNPVSGVSLKLQKSVNGVWTDVSTGTTGADGQITVNGLHWFNYRWVMTGVPAGYVKSADTGFTITYNRLSAENQVILYMQHVSITLDAQVSDIIKEEAPPAFLYEIHGTDAAGVRHTYHLLVQTNETSRFGSNRISGLFAGTYTVMQTPVSRYVPGSAVNISNSTVNGINATVDVLHHTSAEVRFPYTISEYGWYYGVDSQINRLH